MSNYLRPHQIAELREELDTRQKQLSNPYIHDKGTVRARMMQIERQLAEQSPPETTPQERDRLAAEEKSLAEKIQEGMPSFMEMRRNPPGAVGKNIEWLRRIKKQVHDGSDRYGRSALERWKNIRLALYRGSDDPDIASIERLRPTGSTLNMENAQIEGAVFSAPSPQFQANYDKVDWTPRPSGPDPEIESAKAELEYLKEQMEILKRRKQSRVRARKAKAATNPKRTLQMSEEMREKRREQGRRLAERRWGKRAAEPPLATPQEG